MRALSQKGQPIRCPFGDDSLQLRQVYPVVIAAECCLRGTGGFLGFSESALKVVSVATT
jgi:hypothetical protein